MDGTRTGPNAGRGGGRRSLVEKAAGKLADVGNIVGAPRSPSAETVSPPPPPPATEVAQPHSVTEVQQPASKVAAPLERGVEEAPAPTAPASVEPASVERAPKGPAPKEPAPTERASHDTGPAVQPTPAAWADKAAWAEPEPDLAPAGRATRKMVSINFSRLGEAGIMTPNTLRSRTTEELRLIKRGVLAKRWQETAPNSNLLLVTSAVPSEGKTFIALNLAMSIAFERDLRVLLIDADLSRPALPKVLGVDADRGLIDVLTDDSVDLSDVLLRTNIDGFTFLPSGRQHHLSTELLASQRMAKLVNEIAHRYADRIVIFDSPPVLATSEPTALAQHVGQIVFVVRAERTSRHAVKTALDILGEQSQNVQLVLNAARQQFGSASFGYYYYKGYYYGAPGYEAVGDEGRRA